MGRSPRRYHRRYGRLMFPGHCPAWPRWTSACRGIVPRSRGGVDGLSSSAEASDPPPPPSHCRGDGSGIGYGFPNRGACCCALTVYSSINKATRSPEISRGQVQKLRHHNFCYTGIYIYGYRFPLSLSTIWGVNFHVQIPYMYIYDLENTTSPI